MELSNVDGERMASQKGEFGESEDSSFIQGCRDCCVDHSVLSFLTYVPMIIFDLCQYASLLRD